MRKLSNALLFGFILLLLASCAAVKPRNDDPGYALGTEALTLSRAGNYSQASKLYEQAGDVSEVPSYYYLRAADAQLRLGDTSAARRLLRVVDRDRLDSNDGAFFVLLSARVDLNEGRAAQAMKKLDALNYAQLDDRQKLHYHKLRASAYNQLGNMLESARERVAISPMLTDSSERQQNNSAIYDTVSRLPDNVLLNGMASSSDELAGWLALAHVMKETPDVRITELAHWQSLYPAHPANGAFAKNLLQGTPGPVSDTTVPQASELRMAVLLPASGGFAPAAAAIRLGMEQAKQKSGQAEKVGLHFYDTQKEEISSLYRKAVADGSGVVVGPLLKEQLGTLAHQGGLTVPVLALNQVADAAAEHLYQLGLTPEQEVEQLISKAWGDGKRRAAIVAPDTAFGKRLTDFFVNAWTGRGGVVVPVHPYQAGSGNFVELMNEMGALRVNDATAAQGLPEQLPPDFVWLLADTKDGRVIKPYFDSIGLGLPVYAHSSIYSGHVEQMLDQSLNGVVFCDVPWVLGEKGQSPVSQAALKQVLTQVSPDYIRLVALGIDAFSLGAKLSAFTATMTSEMDGATGLLKLGAGHQFNRTLHCAQFEQGKPLLLGAPSHD